jgi:hypothetical protein
MATITGPKGLVKAACWYAKFLGIDGHDFTLHIERKRLGTNRAYLLFDPDEMDGTLVVCPKESRTINMYTAIAHEMVHVKQYVLRELVDTDGPNVYWKGELYKDSSSATEDEAYWNSPWEIEAYGRERGMNYLRMKADFVAKQET